MILNRMDNFRLRLTLAKLDLTHAVFFLCAPPQRIYCCCSLKIIQAQILVMGSMQRQHKQPKLSNKQSQSIDSNRQFVDAIMGGGSSKKLVRDQKLYICNLTLLVAYFYLPVWIHRIGSDCLL